MELNFQIKTSDHRCTPMQLFKGRIALSGVCLSKCDKMSRLPISCVNYTFINQVSYKLSDVYVKRYTYTSRFFLIFISSSQIFMSKHLPLPMHLCLYRADFFIFQKKKSCQVYVPTFKNQESLVLSISKRKREHENQPYNKQHGGHESLQKFFVN